MTNATDNLLEAEKMIRGKMFSGTPTERTLEICRWLFSFNAIEATHKVRCYERNDDSIRFCFDRGEDCNGAKINTRFITIRSDLTIIFKPTNTTAPYLKPDGTYFRIKGSDARKVPMEAFKRLILESYCNKLRGYDLDSQYCKNMT